MNWFTDQRQRWIAETLGIFGFINRWHVIRKFGVSTQQASMDLREFMKRNPGAMTYDAKSKRYVVGAPKVGEREKPNER